MGVSNGGSTTMSAISQIASRFLGGGRRTGTTARPTTGASPRGTTGGSSTDAAIGRGVRGLLGKVRR